jgi:hypothetical protein
MPRRRRAAHLRLWTGLAVLLPALLLAAFLHRPPREAGPLSVRLDAPEARP